MPRIDERWAAAVRDGYAAVNRGDLESAVASFQMADDVEWIEPPEFPGGGTYHGPGGVVEYLAQSRSSWSDATTEPERLIGFDGGIVVIARFRGRRKGRSELVEARIADVFFIDGERVTRMRAYADPGRALAAVGLTDERLTAPDAKGET